MIQATTYSEARQRLSELQESNRRQPVLLNEQGKEPIVLVAVAELADWLETAAYPAKEVDAGERSRLARMLDDLETDYLLCSTENARRLQEASNRAAAGEGEHLSVDQLRSRFGLENSHE